MDPSGNSVVLFSCVKPFLLRETDGTNSRLKTGEPVERDTGLYQGLVDIITTNGGTVSVKVRS